MACCRAPRELLRDSRAKIIGYQFERERLVIFGSYETSTGGCDLFNAKGIADWVCSALLEFHKGGYNVLFEGVLVSMYGPGRLAPLHRASGEGLYVIELNTSPEDCVASVNRRRFERNGGEPIRPKLIIEKMKAIRRNSADLKWLGVPFERLDRERAFARAIELLEIGR
jgi:hypothetical protein